MIPKINPSTLEMILEKSENPVLIIYMERELRNERLLEVVHQLVENSSHSIEAYQVSRRHFKYMNCSFKVVGSPTLLLFKDGILQNELFGNFDKNTLSDFL
jgi:hypothetical protein